MSKAMKISGQSLTFVRRTLCFESCSFSAVELQNKPNIASLFSRFSDLQLTQVQDGSDWQIYFGLCTKGQLISKGLFGVIVATKKPTKLF